MLGVTATQWGMAGAVVAAPQDSGTILTNPAGLALLDIEDVRFDMGFGFLNPPRKANDTDSDSNLYLIPSGAVAFKIDDQITFGMGMAGLSGMGVDFADIMSSAPGTQNVVTTKQFYKIAPGFSYKVDDQLTLGAALNIDYQSLSIDNSTIEKFDQIALDAEQFGDVEVTRKQLAELMHNCIACHEIYRVDSVLVK